MYPRNLQTIWHIDNNVAFLRHSYDVLVKPVFSRYFRKFLVTTPSAEVAKRCIDTLSFQIFLISRFKFSYVVIVSVSVLGMLWCQGNCCSYCKCCFFLSVDEHHIRYVKVYHFIGDDRPVPMHNQVSCFQHQFWLVSIVQQSISIV